MLTIVLWLVLISAGALYLAYHRVSLRAATGAAAIALVAYSASGNGSLAWNIVLWAAFAGLLLLNVDAVRQRYVTKPFLMVYRRMLPTMSDTELGALEAGTVWWYGALPDEDRPIDPDAVFRDDDTDLEPPGAADSTEDRTD